MKKKIFVMLFICSLFSQAVAATYNCKIQGIGTFSWKESNEYLFVNTADWYNSEGRALVCGHKGTNGCDNGTTVLVTGSHYHQNHHYTDLQVYICNSTGGNSWDNIGSSGFPMCRNTAGMRIVTTIGDKDIYAPNSVYTQYAISGYYISDKFCFAQHNNPSTPTPQPNPEPVQPVQPTPQPVQPTPQPRKTCREQRTTLNGKACCDTLSLGVYNRTTDTCECKDGMSFVIENGTGYCRAVVQPTPGVQYTCNETLLAQIAKWKIACAKNSDIVELINQIETYCKGDNRTESVFMTYYNTLLGYNPQQCGASSTSITIDTSAQIANVNNAYSQLVSIHNKFRDNVSVWKDADGKFNTARLASDSIAGVVLGTAGGLITSSVVKKNQVENGFEDIKCTIGGQNVAQWGDQFRVGIQ